MDIIKKICCCSSRPTLSHEENDSDKLRISVNRNQYCSMNDGSSDVRRSSLTASIESGNFSSSSAGACYQRKLESRFVMSCKLNDNGVTNSPELDCFIIPSFGKDTPDNVAVKKMAGDFLRGVGDDFKIIKQLIKQDNCKRLYEVEFMCHFAQEKVAAFEKTIKDAMADLKMKRRGLLIWYTGHGGKGTGDWVLKDGFLPFEVIYELYKRYFKGHHLYIVTDCCYSGAWVMECARLLDNDGITCGHVAKRERIYIKVFAACLPNESAHDKFYTHCQGVKLQSQKDHSKTIMFAEHQKLRFKDHKYSQTTLGVDFTSDDECIADLEGEYCCRSTWSAQVRCLIDEDHQNKYLA